MLFTIDPSARANEHKLIVIFGTLTVAENFHLSFPIFTLQMQITRLVNELVNDKQIAESVCAQKNKNMEISASHCWTINLFAWFESLTQYIPPHVKASFAKTTPPIYQSKIIEFSTNVYHFVNAFCSKHWH
jgi:hypothetical protein